MRNIKEMLVDSGEKSGLLQLNDNQREKLKKVLLEITSDIFDFCEKNNICCMLGGGSVLGAIRHQGFIPWDDDIDLNMPRADYNRFAALFSKEMNEKYEVYVADGYHRVNTSFMRVAKKGTVLRDVFHIGEDTDAGISVDIFPIENVPRSSVMMKIHGVISDIFLRVVVSVMYAQNRSVNLEKLFGKSLKMKVIYKGRCLLGKVLSFKTYEWWFCLFDKFSTIRTLSDKCTIPTGRKRYFGELQDRSVFLPVKKCKFENMEFCIPNDADRYLKSLYGDYMEIPPVEKRERHYYVEIKF